MALKVTVDVSIDEAMDLPTIATFKKHYGPVVNYEAGVIRDRYYIPIIRRFKSKKTKKINFVVYKARWGTPPEGKGKGIWSAVGSNNKKAIFGYLEHGTTWRARKMSPNWVSKTTPGSLNVGAGKGYAMKGKKAWGRFPGIKARNWREAIIKDRVNIFHTLVSHATDNLGRDMNWW